MKKSTKRNIAIALYAAYTVALVLTITFGNSVAKKIIDSFKGIVHHNDIEDVIIHLDEGDVLAANGRYEFTYSVEGKFEGGAGIEFESLSPSVLSIDSDGVIKTYSSFDGIETDARVRITSRNDSEFEKTLTFKVRKIYPESFEVKYYTEGYGYGLQSIEVGMALYPYASTNDKNCLNEYEIVFDREYFTYDSEKCAYVAIKETAPGESVCFTVRYPDGKSRESDPIVINSYTAPGSFDEIRINNKPVDEVTLAPNQSFLPQLYKNGESLATSLDISYTNPSNVLIGKDGRYSFKEAGDHVFTFALPGGYSRTVNVSVRNVMSLPVFEKNDVIDGERITVSGDGKVTLNFTYPSGVTYTDIGYETVGDCVTVIESHRCFYILPKTNGTATLKIYIDDGFDRYERTYVIEVVKNSGIRAKIDEIIEKFVAKFLGHTTLFAFLAVATLNLFRYISLKNKKLKVGIYLASALPSAVSTELIQTLQPGRYPRVADILIDFIGFLVGTVITLLIAYAVKKSRKKRSEAQTSVEDATIVEPTTETELPTDETE